MPSLISDSDKAAMELVMNDIFDTFKRLITVYSSPEKVYISTDPNFSRFGQFGQNNEMQSQEINEQNVQQIYAIIQYNKNPAFEQFNKDKTAGTYEQIKIRDNATKIRVRVCRDGYEILRGVKLLQVDGRDYQIDSPPRVHGLFDATRWDFFFKE